MGRPKKERKRPGPRHKLLVDVHQETWLDFQRWCALSGIIPGELLEEYMAATVQADQSLLTNTADIEA